MKTYTSDEIESLITRFEARKLPKPEWTHEAHLVVAIWYSSRYDAGTAMNLVRQNITNHNESVGTPNSETEGYHETITRFWMITAARFLKNRVAETMDQACNAFILSELAGSGYPLNFYSREILFSTAARKNWVDPDLIEIAAKAH